ncbi:hypothetical protein PC129_g9981 [Phytophthora cactorum]|uniref:Uncharacterized protein n=1 Tax=Phytophthora cactorum TaxID=29920 RepID=A0A8T1D3K7_9STRA|nr:hypothetical protein Pcac1_g8760 [Phytophthora cactorum]KAG2901103.1 hypothetical protein PC114_g13305 [Phytophthora cactorum]KAG2932912.1 hypothetical protein PC117_g13008 [Phytophthora cactorum]KAG3011657.1 hypothetical protein PC119_g13154 [Phytophthora cactorum]KAG3015256.1 hypothetical protein PC120_g12255 [Phytophthora cactorum]
MLALEERRPDRALRGDDEMEMKPMRDSLVKQQRG